MTKICETDKLFVGDNVKLPLGMGLKKYKSNISYNNFSLRTHYLSGKICNNFHNNNALSVC